MTGEIGFVSIALLVLLDLVQGFYYWSVHTRTQELGVLALEATIWKLKAKLLWVCEWIYTPKVSFVLSICISILH